MIAARRAVPVLNPYLDLHHAIIQSVIQPESVARIRKKLVAAYAWAIPSREALELLADHGPLLELGAGTGYWAHCLKQVGVDIIAWDRNPGAPPHWTEVVAGEPHLLSDPASPHHARTLFLCWPPLNEPMAAEAVKLYRGGTLAEIGEARDGCTGSEAFYDELERNWRLTHELPLPRWPGIEDSLRIWQRAE